MATASAGLLLFRERGSRLEVLLAHPGGPYWAMRDDGAWSIPKGELMAGEDPLAAARREFREETGFEPAQGCIPLGSIRQRGGKVVHAWAVEQDLDPSGFRSDTFTLEWPPRSGRRGAFPEIDRLEWFPIEVARSKILPAQAALLDQLGAARRNS
ncbi:MAG TPA: NUDIX domain-containing protein [Phycisphaerales bacterium]|nr:NUDIX domain-containing protein [Phycisphaerales bacterium]